MNMRQPEDYAKEVARQVVLEVGAGLMDRHAAQVRELAAKEALDAWAKTAAEFRQNAPDFDTVALAPDLVITMTMAEAIRASGRGADIAYYLGKNPADAARIASLPMVSQAMAIARLEGVLVAPETTK